MEKKLNTTTLIRQINEEIIALRESLPKIVTQSFFQRRIPVSEKLEYLRALSASRARIWQEAAAAYPELKGKNYSIGNSFITYQEEETLNPTPKII